MTRNNSQDAICGLATTPGGGIGIIRISSADETALDVLRAVFSAESLSCRFKSHKMYYGKVISPDGGVIDECMAVYFAAPRSYTRENVAEIHCHGGFMSVQRILAEITARGVRLAEPGEFTKRAFLNGRIDLSQAEAVMDTIRAKTDSAHRAAVSRLGGRLRTGVTEIRERLLTALAHIEVSIDYPEHDAGGETLLGMTGTLSYVSAEISRILNTYSAGKIMREGIRTAIIGRPNVGKSSLLNALAGEERAIVTDIAGTTRDLITEQINIGGIPFLITDTAGIRESGDIIEKTGISRSYAAAESAELIICMLDGSDKLCEDDFKVLEIAKDRLSICLVNKSDLESVIDKKKIGEFIPFDNIIYVSAETGEGLDQFRERAMSLFAIGNLGDSDLLISSQFNYDALFESKNSVNAALSAIEAGMPEDIVSVDLQDAVYSLGKITGETADDELIERIFSQFCLGK